MDCSQHGETRAPVRGSTTACLLSCPQIARTRFRPARARHAVSLARWQACRPPRPGELPLILLPRAQYRLACVPAMAAWLSVRIRAAVHDVRYALPEFPADFTQPWQTALILHGIVQQCRNGHLFVATIFDCDGSYAQQVADVRATGALAELHCVQLSRIAQRRNKLLREGFPFWRFCFARRLVDHRSNQQ